MSCAQPHGHHSLPATQERKREKQSVEYSEHECAPRNDWTSQDQRRDGLAIDKVVQSMRIPSIGSRDGSDDLNFKRTSHLACK